MDFAFTQDQETLRGHLKDLLDEVCTPEYAARCDDQATPPREAYNALAKNGWFGLIIPQEYGGTGGSAIDLAILLEEAGKHFAELAMWLFRTLTYGGYAVMAGLAFTPELYCAGINYVTPISHEPHCISPVKRLSNVPPVAARIGQSSSSDFLIDSKPGLST